MFTLLAAGVCGAAGPAKIVLMAGKPSHPPGAHEHNAGVLLLEKLLKQNKNVEPVVVKGGWPENESVFDGARAIFLFSDGFKMHPWLVGDRLSKVDALMKKGVGLMLMHYAVEIPKDNGPQYLEWVGGYYERPYSQNPINDVDATQASPKHPVSRGWKGYHVKDEFYYRLRFTDGDKRDTPILTVPLPKDKPEPQVIAWACQRQDGSRGFGFTGGHFHTNWGIPEFRQMVVNAILWTAKVDLPKNGARCDLNPDDLKHNLDDKPTPAPKKKK
jgi:type 1 glutamine amidotransferase